MDRGILSTLYTEARGKIQPKALHDLYLEFYAKEPFVRIRPLGTCPATHEVRFSNYCDLGLHFDERSGRVVVISAIDNLTKGAAGGAVQWMNRMLGDEETAGLMQPAGGWT